MSIAFVAAAALLAAAAPPQGDGVPAAYTCDATTEGGRTRAYAMTGPDYGVSGRLRLTRKADHDERWMASGNVQILSSDGQHGAYLIVGGSSDFLSDIVQARLVIRRDGKRHREYEIAVFKAEANLNFSLEIDADGAVRAKVGKRSVAAKTDLQGQRARLGLGCHRGAVSFSALSIAPQGPQAENK